MKVDKQNQNVCYNDEKHMYWDENGVYVSVTTLIGKFCQDFDKDFWSGYKALEKLLSADEFKAEKSQLLNTHKIDVKYFCDMYGFTVNDYNKAQLIDLGGTPSTDTRTAAERNKEVWAWG